MLFLFFHSSLSPRKEHSSFTNASQITQLSPDNQQQPFGSDAEDADDEDDDDDIIDIDSGDSDDDDDDDDDNEDLEEEDDDAAPSTIDIDEDDALDDERTESELKIVEGRHKMSFQQLKEGLIGSVSMTRF